jgi:hypothetical protein
MTFIQRNGQKHVTGGKPYKADFVCTRGVLKKVMQFPYFQDNFEIEAEKFKNTIYLALKYINVNDPTNSTSFGYQFENCLLSSNPHDDPGVSEGREFCVVIRRIINDFNVLFNVECDGIESKTVVKSMNDLKNSSIVELKTRVDTPKYLKEKQFEWLIQSHVAGIIDKIYEGKRDKKQNVKKMELYDLEALEDEVKEMGCDINRCYAYLHKFLCKVKAKMSSAENVNQVFVYKFKKELKFPPKNIQIGNQNNQNCNYRDNQFNKVSSSNINCHRQQRIATNWIPDPVIANHEILQKQYINFINKYNH